MADHSWIADVIIDLENYVAANGGRASKAALSHALSITVEELGLDKTGLRQRLSNHNGPLFRGEPGFDTPCTLVVDNTLVDHG